MGAKSTVMSANAFDTLKAARSLKSAGFDEVQAEAIVSTVGDAVREHTAPLASSTAAIADSMARKKDVETVADRVATISDSMATKSEVAVVVDRVATISDTVATISSTMATKSEVATVVDRVATISGTMATKSEVATVADKVATISDTVVTISNTMATREYVQAAIALEMKALYRHLWVVGTSAIGITVALMKLLP